MRICFFDLLTEHIASLATSSSRITVLPVPASSIRRQPIWNSTDSEPSQNAPVKSVAVTPLPFYGELSLRSSIMCSSPANVERAVPRLHTVFFRIETPG